MQDLGPSQEDVQSQPPPKLGLTRHTNRRVRVTGYIVRAAELLRQQPPVELDRGLTGARYPFTYMHRMISNSTHRG